MAGLGRKVFTAGEVLTAIDVQSYLQDQAVMVFAGTAARASAIPTPTEGMVTFQTDTDQLTYYDGANWDRIAPLDAPTFTGIVTIPAGASISGFAPLAAPAFTGSGTVNLGRLGAVVGGSGTTTSGSNLTVTHGLGTTPTAVAATVRANTYSAALNTNIFVGNIGATTFTVFANNGAGGAVASLFNWIAVA